MSFGRDMIQFLSGLFVHRSQNLRPSALRSPGQEFAVFGLGRFGSSVAMTLVERGYTVLGIDRDARLVQQYADEITQTVSIDSTDEDALRDIDITSYDTVVVAIGTNFEANLMTTVACKELGVRNVICKAATQKQRDILLKVGADRVVLPEHDGGYRIAQELSTPGVLDRIRLTDTTSVTALRVPSRLVGRTLGQASIEKNYGLGVTALVSNGSVLASPTANTSLGGDDLLIVVGSETDLVRLVHG